MHRDYTATVFVIADERVLLLWHKKMERWMPPGGHLEPGEAPWEGAVREVKEETGLEVDLGPHTEIAVPNAHSFPAPLTCLLEEIPETPYNPPHQHVDFIYVGRPVGGELKENPNESDGLRWFSRDEVKALCPEREILPDAKQLIEMIFNEESPIHRSHSPTRR